jgi:hypothetical protein
MDLFFRHARGAPPSGSRANLGSGRKRMNRCFGMVLERDAQKDRRALVGGDYRGSGVTRNGISPASPLDRREQ